MRNIGPYEVLEEAGQGGMGVVYRARDPRLSREVALKVLRTVERRAVQRLIREAESLARLRHPNVVRVHGVEEHQGNPVLVMEWVAGESLQERLDRLGPLEPREAVGLVCSLAEALAYAHGQGVLHRDLKPANVLLDETGTPRLTDFGIAQLVDGQGPRLSQSGALIGSPGYFAPEQALGRREEVGPWTDIYGLGGTLYAALTGGPPFAGMSLGELAVAAVEQEPEPPSKRAPGIDPSLDAICARCLAKDPARRFASAADLADVLAGSLSLASGSPRWAVFALALAPALVLALLLVLMLHRGPAAAPFASPPAPDVAPIPTAAPAGRSPQVAADLARAKARYARKEYVAALEAAEQVLEQEPDSLEGLTARAMIQVELGAAADARRDIARLLALAPGSHLGYYALGIFEWKAGRLQEAVDVFGQAIERKPDHVASWVHRSSCLGALGRIEGAMSDLRRVLELEPQRAESRVELATYLLNTSAFEEARAEIDRAIALEETPQGLCIRGTIRLAQGDREGAVLDLNEAIARDPKLNDAYRTRGLLRAMDGDMQGGLVDLDQALALVPGDPQARAERVQILQDLGNFARAEVDIRQILAARPKDQGGLMLWTRQAMLQGQDSEALRRVEVALAEYPDWAKLYGKRGVLRLRLGQLEGSVADCGRALRSRGELYVALRTRATALARLGRFAEAAADLRKLLEELPSHKRRDRPALERQLAECEQRASARR